MGRDRPDAKPRDAVHIVFANEKVRPQEPLPNPDVAESEQAALRPPVLFATVSFFLSVLRRLVREWQLTRRENWVDYQ